MGGGLVGGLVVQWGGWIGGAVGGWIGGAVGGLVVQWLKLSILEISFFF